MNDPAKIVNRVSVVTIAGNVLLTGAKFAAGFFGHSGAMVSDAVHSLSDVLTTLIAWGGIRVSVRAADREHPYGHERLECVASVILGAGLLLTGFSVGMSGCEKIVSGSYADLPRPNFLALAAAIVSIVAKEVMYHYTARNAKKVNSSALMADAWHHRSDAMSSVGSLIGVGGAILGYPVMDPIASVVICLFILKVSLNILIDATKKMLDTSCPDEYEKRLRECILAHPGVIRVDMLHTRMFGNKVYIDADIAVEGEMTLREAHDIAETVHADVEKDFDNIKHIMIHVNPA